MTMNTTTDDGKHETSSMEEGGIAVTTPQDYALEETMEESKQSDAAPPAAPTTSSNKKRHLVVWTVLGVAAALALIVGLSVGLLRKSSDATIAPTFDVALDTVSRSTLTTTYASCDELRLDLRQASGYLANAVIDANARWYFHQDGPYSKRVDRQPVAETTALDKSRQPSTAQQPDGITEDSYGTNNQVDGVEEADIVKTDGENVYVAYGSEIVVLHADNVTVLDRIQIPSTECLRSEINSLLLVSQKLVVIVSSNMCNQDAPYGQVVSGSHQTRVLLYDITPNTTTSAATASTSLELIQQTMLQGSYISAHAINDNVHVVTSTFVNTRFAFGQYLDPYNENVYDRSTFAGDETEFRAQAYFQALGHQDDFVEQLLSQLSCASLQQVVLWQSSGDAAALNFASIMETLSSVYSFSIKDNETALENIHQTSMLLPTRNWQVYASLDRLVVASEGWFVVDDNESMALQQTYLVTYQLDAATATPYSLSTVPGYMLNQFSMDHYYSEETDTDYLRVATSTRDRWTWNSRGRWTQSDDTTSQVTILEMTELMPIVGQVTGLGKPGERIYAVRFQGDTAFAVTFRQTDPFYTLDLSDPSNPQKVGELEIPGFSNYLHPITTAGEDGQEQDLILGVGQYADQETVTGIQISLFDVSDFANPQRIQSFAEDGGYSSSEAQYDHKAFRYLPESRILILPLTVYTRGDDEFDGFRLYKIDPETGITPYVSIEHASSLYGGCWSRSAHLDARSMVFGGDILTLKGHSILSHDLTTKLVDAAPIHLDSNLTTDCSSNYLK